ncbi:hypothetical protein SAMN02745146_0261 [Hymenobacter daecheongensis DSM 21074]|uniref:Uncharacterized protein n=1 Tax=Hymenobacter daecheongensis DSM 21074 TaxID=1121955 RepID=A0A1M6MF38_9BACT|nr:hypothetical protein [Hymenobacter daecheongensis]SHJ82071.1 hypothetical protein SAMN02745146_0261 [Hymenobacter daecheongensis DSM 21074]
MPNYLRDQFGLTQERLASWLGIARGTLAMGEGNGSRGLPGANWVNNLRLLLAGQGKVYDPATPDAPHPAPPPLPPPPITTDPLAWRVRVARHEMYQLTRRLERMQARAAQHNLRLAALPALRAYAGPVENPAREAGWLALFEGEAVDELRDLCGAGPQRLLEARLAGLVREVELLEELLPPPEPA